MMTTMNTRIYPNWEQLNNLKSPLTNGERSLADFLDANLPEDWEIYVQPYFNGDRPDIVILHPKVGIVIYEVKDWSLSLYKNESVNKGNMTWYETKVKDKSGVLQKIPHPIKQVERYRDNLLHYMPRVAQEVDENFKKISVLKIGIYFHNATTQEARDFISNYKEKHCLVFGFDALQRDNLIEIVPDIGRSSSYYMTEHWEKEIRFWLIPPYHFIEQGQPIILSSEQKRHISPSPQQHQRLRGVAGSGKTLVIAQRAANLISLNKKVLVVSYNITLWHHIKDQVSRARLSFNWDKIEFNHLHGFCKNYLYENNIDFPKNIKNDLDNENYFFDETVPSLIIESMKKGNNVKSRMYDAILIDEAQDYVQKYYDMLCLFLSDNDEVLLVADEKQNIYERDISWVDKMQGTKFRGRWRELKESYRLSIPVIKRANDFAKDYLPEVGLFPEPSVNQKDMFDTPFLIWRNIDKDRDVCYFLLQTYEWLTKTKNISPSDIVILIPTHVEGNSVKLFFEEKNIKVNDVFEPKRGDKRHKHSFWMGDSRLKMSTIHSFKGWELSNIVFLTPDREWSNIDYLMYVAITRTVKNLIVLNRLEKYTSYGDTWQYS